MPNINWKNKKIRFLNTARSLWFLNSPASKIKVVGVTGTNGKTTTATLLYKVTMGLGFKAGLISTVENIIVGEVIKPKEGKAPGTSPDLIYLYELLNEMAEKGCEYVFMEVSSHAMDQNRVAGVNFVGGIFTNLTQDHLDYHKSMENYFAAKKKFFKALPASAFALSNIDDEFGKKMLEEIKARKFTYGFKNLPEEGLRGISPKSFFGEKLETNLLGGFNAYNALAVYSAAILLGFDKNKVKEILKHIEPPRGRFEHFTSQSGVLVIVDYAHTPDALENVLKTSQGLRKEGASSRQDGRGKIISVFGCGGDRDPIKRKIMGKIGATLSDIAIFTSDNPRSEDPDKIIEQMKEGLSAEVLNKVKTFPNRHEAIIESVKLAQKGDIILCAGKGHENYQEINGVKNHFNDMEEYKKLYQ